MIDNAEYIISPLADAFVRDGSFAAINYGQDTTLLIKATPVSGFTRKAYIKFSLTDANYTVTSAKLRIYGFNKDNTAPISVSCYGVDDDSWTENGITYSNAPAGTATALSTAVVNNQAKYIEFDVTNYIKTQLAGDKIASFVLRDPANKNVNLIFNSRDNIHNKPELIIY